MRYLVLSLLVSFITGISASTKTVAAATTIWSLPALAIILLATATITLVGFGIVRVHRYGIERF